MPHGAVVRPVLQSDPDWPILAAGGGFCAGHMGAGGERDVFRGHVHPHPQSRAHVAAVIAPDLHSRGGGHGDRHYGRAHGRVFSHEPDKIPGRILRHLYDHLFPAVSNGVERRMKSPIFFVLLTITLGLLGWGTYQALVVAPPEATMGDAQRIFYYHVPAATAASILFWCNFVASLWYLWNRSPVA